MDCSRGIGTSNRSIANEGFPAAPNTGELVAVGHDGTFRTIASGLNQPTSLDFIGHSAFVVTLTGTILRIDGIYQSHIRA